MTVGATARKAGAAIGWAGALPSHWDIAKICLVARLESGHTPSRQHPEYWVPSECSIPWFSLADVWQIRDGTRDYLGETAECVSELGVANSAARVLPAGTVVLSRTASVGFAGIMPRPMATTQDFANWVCGPRLQPEFLLYVFRAMRDDFRRLTMGSTHQTIYMPDIRRMTLPVPPRSEQARIVAFLRARLPTIDALIAKKEQMIVLLDEKRQALITHAITKGIDPGVQTRFSGSTALGVIPAHWRVVRLMHLTPARRQIMYGIVLPGPNVPDGVPIVKSGDCTPRRLKIDLLHRTTREIESEYARSRLAEGDIVIAIRGSVGAVAIVPADVAGANLTQDAARIAPLPTVNNRWLLFALQARAVWSQLESVIVGATVKGLNIRDLKRPYLPVPPKDEQAAIAGYLDRSVEALDRLSQVTARSVDRLREYRQALITAAVTGKIDVRAEEAA